MKAHLSEGTSREPLGFAYAGTEQAAIVRDGRRLRCRRGVFPLAIPLRAINAVQRIPQINP